MTGGTGTLGAIVARHLVTAHGIRSLLLTSRRGPEAPGATRLVGELEAVGATVTVAACDTSDRAALAAVIAGLPADRPLRGVVHAAGVLDDGVVGALTPERCATVWAPKATGAWHLHESAHDLGLDLTAFVVFSSTAGTVGAAGQANYAAASAFVDALVEHRHAAGLPALSLAWGLWDEASGLTAAVDDTVRARFRRTGIQPVATAEALDLLDRALASGSPAVAALNLDLGGLRSGRAPAVWRSMVGGGTAVNRFHPSPAGAGDDRTGLALRLVGLGPAERRRALADLVRAEAAAVLGHAGPEAVAPDRPFKDLGVDSLTAVELRNRLGAQADLVLPTTVVFDQPTVDALARELDHLLAPAAVSPEDEARRRLAELESALAALPGSWGSSGSSASSGEGDRALAAELRAGLERALSRLSGSGGGPAAVDELATASAADLMALIDRELGPEPTP